MHTGESSQIPALPPSPLSQVPETVCSVVEIPVPSQAKLHKQWCLFDQREGDIDFDREVRKIAGRVEEQLARVEEQLAREEEQEDNTLNVFDLRYDFSERYYSK